MTSLRIDCVLTSKCPYLFKGIFCQRLRKLKRRTNFQHSTSRLGFLVGWLLFAMAFLLAGAESILGQGFITPAHELCLRLAPAKWIILQSHLPTNLLNILEQTVLQLPAWLLFGAPALSLIWFHRPHRDPVDPELFSSLTTFDRLAALAKEEGALDDDPTYQEYHLEDYATDFEKEIAELRKPAHDYLHHFSPEYSAKLEIEDSPEERMQKARDQLSIPYDKIT